MMNISFPRLPRSASPLLLSMLFFAALLFAPEAIRSEPAAEQVRSLVIAQKGQTDYQIVLPDSLPSHEIEEGLAEITRLMQAAFAANGTDMQIVRESGRDPDKPGIYLGATEFAKAAGVDLAQLEGYDYVHKVIGRDLIVAGNDQVSRVEIEHRNHTKPLDLDRIATAKAALDFLREHAGARFLYPDFGATLSGGRPVDFASSPGIEFLPAPVIAVPANLDLRKRAHITYIIWRNRNSIYHLANNFFPTFNALWSCHSHERAVPEKTYYDTHPEYFALIGGQRARGRQYCISNPGFQDLIYQYAADSFDAGHERVYMGHSDGFRPCQCQDCNDLYETGSDWTEKLWIFNRKIAERLQASHPGKTIVLTAYTVTERAAPRTFDRFPPNTMLMMCGTNESDLDKWRAIKIPQGLTSFIYSWCPSYCSRYVPMMTPTSVERQMQRLYRHNTRGIYHDGSPDLYGLQGPTGYVFGRFWDDPENSSAEALTQEFIAAAYGRAAPSMTRFYESLHKAIAIYAEYFGTRLEGWGRVNDGFQLLSFLYPPKLLTELDESLGKAEAAADNDRVRARLALVRREFDWLRVTLKVIHLYPAHAIEPESSALRDRLLDSIDARNAYIDSLYNARGNASLPHPAWNTALYPIPGHDASHLRLVYPRYRENFHTTALNWDTAALRATPSADARRLDVKRTDAALAIDAPVWQTAPAEALAAVAGSAGGSASTIRVLHGPEALHVLFENEFPGGGGDATADFVEVFLAPLPGKNVYYRFQVDASGGRSEAATGLIEDTMHLRFGAEDPDWTGPWQAEVRPAADGRSWTAWLSIPYTTLGSPVPTPGTSLWRANFSRGAGGTGKPAASLLWSGGTRVDDRDALGVLDFPQPTEAEKWHAIRARGGFDDQPEDWAQLPNPLPAGNWGVWRCRTDPVEQGLREHWQAPEYDDSQWAEVRVPAWYTETAIGAYNGIAWYRMRFQVPEAWTGEDLRILFAAVDKEAWIYLNGQLVREHTAESEGKKVLDLYDSSFSADVPAALVRAGAENVLTVRVRNTFAGGGITRPVLIHAPSNTAL